MNQGSILNEKIKISKEIEKLKKFKQKELTKKQQNTYMVFDGLFKKTEKSFDVSVL